jgi:hypothetical protein
MAIATNAQVQRFADDRVRPRCEQIRALYLACKSDKASIDDIYANLTQDNPPDPWTDGRADNPAHLLTSSDVLSVNAFITGFIALIEGGDVNDMTNASAQTSKVLAACLRVPGL